MSIVPTDPDDLYGLPLERFTAARDALAKELARQGEKTAAAEVKALAKPSKTAWALNQLARQQPEAVEALLAAGQRVREAQRRALEGDPDDLRAATRAEHEQVDRLVDAALAVLGEGSPRADRVRATLRAAATDAAAGDLLRRGRLVADLQPSGFGLEGLGDLDLPPRRPTAGDQPGTVEDTEGRAKAENDREAAARRARQRSEATRLRGEAVRLRREAERAQERARRLLHEAERAEQRAREARAEAEAAADAATDAERLAVEAAGRVEALERG